MHIWLRWKTTTDAETRGALCISPATAIVKATVKGAFMHVSYGALIVGALGLIYGLVSERLSEKQRAAGAIGLLIAAIALIVVPFLLGVPW